MAFCLKHFDVSAGSDAGAGAFGKMGLGVFTFIDILLGGSTSGYIWLDSLLATSVGTVADVNVVCILEFVADFWVHFSSSTSWLRSCFIDDTVSDSFAAFLTALLSVQLEAAFNLGTFKNWQLFSTLVPGNILKCVKNRCFRFVARYIRTLSLGP